MKIFDVYTMMNVTFRENMQKGASQRQLQYVDKLCKHKDSSHG